MRAAAGLFSCALILASAAMMLADYSQPPAETPFALQLSSHYLEDDFWSIEQMRPGVARLGYPLAARVLGPVLDRDASSAYRWTDLAEVFDGAGDREKAEYCYHRAGELAPHDPQILVAVGDFYTRQGDARAAVSRFAIVLSQMGGAPGDILTHNVFVYYERLGIRKNGLLDKAIPDAPSARAYLRYLMMDTDGPVPQDVWRWMQSKTYDDEPLAIDYESFLLRKKQIDAAQEVWLQRFASRKDGYSLSLPVFNGGFEYEFTGGDPDWHFDAIDGVKVKRDHASRFDGLYALRVDFTGNDNPDFHNFHETIFVQPGRYRFEAHVRTAHITSDQGVGFRLVSAQDGKVLADTPLLTGTNDWKRLDATFEIPPGTRLINVQFVRHRSIRIDNQLTGTAWLDEVKLQRVQ
jgi:hypothetical protein